MSSEDFVPIDFTAIESQDTQERKDKFQQLYSLNLNDKVENKNGLSYLSWANAWAAFKAVYPNATYRIIKNPQTNLPYFSDETGIMVYTEVIADHTSYEMFLPVMDSSNRAMKLQPYTYQVWDKTNRKYVDRKVEAATMFDINKTVMRCLVKNLAMFGLGLYIYAGEDMPEAIDTTGEEAPTTAAPKKTTRRGKAPSADPLAAIKAAINGCNTPDDLLNLYRQHQGEIQGRPEILQLFTTRKLQLAA